MWFPNVTNWYNENGAKHFPKIIEKYVDVLLQNKTWMSEIRITRIHVRSYGVGCCHISYVNLHACIHCVNNIQVARIKCNECAYINSYTDIILLHILWCEHISDKKIQNAYVCCDHCDCLFVSCFVGWFEFCFLWF